MAEPKLLRASYDLRLEIGGVDYPLYAAGITIRLDSIPQASVELAVGFEAGSGNTSATQKSLANVKFMTAAKLYMTASGEKNATEEWDDEEHVIFEGFYVGATNPSDVRGLSVSVNLIHWSVALTFSTVLTPKITGGSPSLYSSPAVYSATGASSSAIFSSLTLREASKQQFNISIWDGIKSFLTDVANQENIAVNLNPALELFVPAGSEINTQGLDVLENMVTPEGASTTLKIDNTSYKIVSDAIADTIMQETVNSFSVSTFWDKLVRAYLPYTMLNVIPRLSRDDGIWVVPVLNGARSFYTPTQKAGGTATIELGEYDRSPSQSRLFRPRKGVILSGVTSDLVDVTRTKETLLISSNAFYIPDNPAVVDGSIMTATAPAWASRLVAMSSLSLAFLGTDGKKISRGISGRSSADSTPTKDSEGRSAKDLMEISSNVLAAYAKWYYVQNALIGNTMQISGPLRFDICPGSTVKVEGRSRRHVEDDQLEQSVVGTVIEVNINIVKNPRPDISTSFVIGSVRTENDNENTEGYSIDQHPLYPESTWVGGKLSEI